MDQRKRYKHSCKIIARTQISIFRYLNQGTITFLRYPIIDSLSVCCFPAGLKLKIVILGSRIRLFVEGIRIFTASLFIFNNEKCTSRYEVVINLEDQCIYMTLNNNSVLSALSLLSLRGLGEVHVFRLVTRITARVLNN